MGIIHRSKLFLSVLLCFPVWLTVADVQCQKDTLCLSCTVANTVGKIKYQGWNAFSLSNKYAEAVVVPDIARIMDFHLSDRHNILWQNKELAGVASDITNKEWQNFGGAKLWVAPQSEWGWPPDPRMDRGMCRTTIKNGGLVLEGMPSPAMGVRLDRSICFGKPVVCESTCGGNAASVFSHYCGIQRDKDNCRCAGCLCQKKNVACGHSCKIPNNACLNVSYTMSNISTGVVSWGIWNVIQVKPGGEIILPVPEKADIWGSKEVASGDWRRDDKEGLANWVKRDGVMIMQHNKQISKTFATSSAGWVAYKLDNTLFILAAFDDYRATFPPGEANIEIYTNGSYIELEHIAPLVTLASGEKISTREKWFLVELNKEYSNKELFELIKRILVN